MQTIEISNDEFFHLQKMVLPNVLYNGEGSFHFFEETTQGKTTQKLLKKFRMVRGPVFENKLRTICSLHDLKSTDSMSEFVLPDKIVTVNNKAVGYSMDYVKSTNLKVILQDPKVDYQTKIDLLKEVGTILRKMQEMRKQGVVSNFYLNDLHEGNFILDSQTGHIRVVDLDSATIGDNLPFVSRYLSPYAEIKSLPGKYHQVENEACLGDYMPDANSDLYCYVMMILNILTGIDTYKLTVKDYYEYLDFLSDLGISREIIECFAKIYSSEDNVNPDEYLDELVPFMGQTSYRSYVMRPKS